MTRRHSLAWLLLLSAVFACAVWTPSSAKPVGPATAIEWTDPAGDAHAAYATGLPLDALSDPAADIVSTEIETTRMEYRISITVSGEIGDRFYRVGSHPVGTESTCRAFHILDPGGVAKVNFFCGAPRELISSHVGRVVVVDGDTVSATFPRRTLPTYADEHRAQEGVYSYTCVAEGDCEEFIDSSSTDGAFTL